MLKELTIKAYKSIEHQEFKLAPLTLLTGVNSSGKSSVIQSILLLMAGYQHNNLSYLNELAAPFVSFDSSHCRWSKEDYISLQLKTANQESLAVEINSKKAMAAEDNSKLSYAYEENFYYLAANRLGEEEVSKFDHTLDCGSRGQFLLGTFEALRNSPVHAKLQHPDAATPNLKAQLSFWLKNVLEQDVEFESKKIAADLVQNTFKYSDIGEISPRNVGAGNSYITKLLVLGLISEPGHLLIIENPEIHLHPKAQAKLAGFFSYLAHRGVQIIIETHSEHFINGTRYQVYKDKIKADEVAIYYKNSMMEPFISLLLNEGGHYINEESELTSFPKGFFDATLSELLEIG